MRAARGATSSATKWRTRPTSSACSALRPSSPRVVIGPASTQLHLYLPCRFPQEWETTPSSSSIEYLNVRVIPQCHEKAQPLAQHPVGGSPLLRQTVCLYARNLRMCWATVHTSPRWLATSISARVL